MQSNSFSTTREDKICRYTTPALWSFYLNNKQSLQENNSFRVVVTMPKRRGLSRKNREKARTKKPPWKNLPNEMWTHVFSFVVCYTDWSAVRQTCKKFNELGKTLFTQESALEKTIRSNDSQLLRFLLDRVKLDLIGPWVFALALSCKSNAVLQTLSRSSYKGMMNLLDEKDQAQIQNIVENDFRFDDSTKSTDRVRFTDGFWYKWNTRFLNEDPLHPYLVTTGNDSVVVNFPFDVEVNPTLSILPTLSVNQTLSAAPTKEYTTRWIPTLSGKPNVSMQSASSIVYGDTDSVLLYVSAVLPTDSDLCDFGLKETNVGRPVVVERDFIVFQKTRKTSWTRRQTQRVERWTRSSKPRTNNQARHKSWHR